MMKRISGSYLIIIFSVIGLFLFNACSHNTEEQVQSAETTYNRALESFKKEDWEEASKLFDIIKLQYPTSPFADKAQYYIAEIHFKKEEFVLAAFNYNQLRRIYPASPYYKEAMFKTALSFYNLSPSYDRDQEYTYKAIDAFQDFQRLYPNDSLYSESTKYIMELRNKLANRDYFTANLYRKLYSPGSSIIYYDSVIENYPDTDFYEPAMLGKIQVLAEMGKTEDARGAIEAYRRVFPNGKLSGEVRNVEMTLK